MQMEGWPELVGQKFAQISRRYYGNRETELTPL